MTVREMLDRISSRELAEWAAYEELFGPLGPERDDVLASISAAATYNAQRTKSSDPVVRPADLMPQWSRRQQSWQEQLSIVEQLNAAFGGSVVERG